MNRLRLQSESGFTLIELLVVVAIIGILAAIAIPQFAAYRKRGHEAQVKSDLRNAAVAQESYFAANSAYKSGALTSSTPPGFSTRLPVFPRVPPLARTLFSCPPATPIAAAPLGHLAVATAQLQVVLVRNDTVFLT